MEGIKSALSNMGGTLVIIIFCLVALAFTLDFLFKLGKAILKIVLLATGIGIILMGYHYISNGFQFMPKEKVAIEDTIDNINDSIPDSLDTLLDNYN